MDTTQDLNKTVLNDRVLWFDGDSSIPAEKIDLFVSMGIPLDGICVNEITDEIRSYNSLVSKEQQIKIKENLTPLNYDWNLPEYFMTLDIDEYTVDKLVKEIERKQLTDDQVQLRVKRTLKELNLFKKLELDEVLRALIYIINTLHQHKIVWGVGRGSSVSSYVLYLIGVHDVDSVKYELEIEDFLRS